MLIRLCIIADAFCLIGDNPDVVHIFSAFAYTAKVIIYGMVMVPNSNHWHFFLVSNISV